MTKSQTFLPKKGKLITTYRDNHSQQKGYTTLDELHETSGEKKNKHGLWSPSKYTLRIQSPSQMMIGVYNHLLRKVFRFHYHSQKVIGSLGIVKILNDPKTHDLLLIRAFQMRFPKIIYSPLVGGFFPTRDENKNYLKPPSGPEHKSHLNNISSWEWRKCTRNLDGGYDGSSTP